jgi:hypothetical protein
LTGFAAKGCGDFAVVAIADVLSVGGVAALVAAPGLPVGFAGEPAVPAAVADGAIEVALGFPPGVFAPAADALDCPLGGVGRPEGDDDAPMLSLECSSIGNREFFSAELSSRRRALDFAEDAAAAFRDFIPSSSSFPSAFLAIAVVGATGDFAFRSVVTAGGFDLDFFVLSVPTAATTGSLDSGHSFQTPTEITATTAANTTKIIRRRERPADRPREIFAAVGASLESASTTSVIDCCFNETSSPFVGNVPRTLRARRR